MSNTRVSIVVVARERFSIARASLESIFANTEEPFELIYVDGRSPRSLRRWLAQQATQRGFRLLRSDHYLSPNEARNIGLAAVETELVVFFDNDEDYQRGDAALSAMPAGDTPGQRTSVTKYQVAMRMTD